MSILIEGMEMPTSCHDCIFFAECFCPVLPTEHYWTSREGIHPDCPLIELPPHGRLIDADDLANSITGAIYHSDLREAPTIIPAEEGE